MINATWTITCNCGANVTRYRGQSVTTCPCCGTDYNPGGQRLRNGWANNPSNHDDDVDDLTGHELAHANDH